ncbi:MAG: exodeoxyribonuclease VII small subunit [Sulfuricella sp.]|nr:exodeoxyribonuclease VII small subunit [Gammaproteobacteria bacterium]
MSKASKPQTFESALAELENIVSSMEAGQLPLEQLLSAYKRGAELLQFCQQALRDAQQEVRILEAGSLKSLPAAEADIPSANNN